MANRPQGESQFPTTGWTLIARVFRSRLAPPAAKL